MDEYFKTFRAMGQDLRDKNYDGIILIGKDEQSEMVQVGNPYLIASMIYSAMLQDENFKNMVLMAAGAFFEEDEKRQEKINQLLNGNENQS